jgi:hypothetical protein
VRRCSKCGGPILRGDKWRFNAEGRIEHRHCDAPQSYTGVVDAHEESELRRKWRQTK